MSQWLFLMFLYLFFGWMKKKQQKKDRETIESQEGWNTGKFIDFGEGILEEILGDDSKEKNVKNDIVYEATEDNIFDEEIIGNDLENELVEDIPKDHIIIEENVDNISNQVDYKKHKHNQKRLMFFDSILNKNDPIKAAVIFKEILDKPRALRKK